MADIGVYIYMNVKKHIKTKNAIILSEAYSFAEGEYSVVIRAGTIDSGAVVKIGNLYYNERTNEFEVLIGDFKRTYTIDSEKDIPTILKNLEITVNEVGFLNSFSMVKEIVDDEIETPCEQYVDMTIKGKDYYYMPGFIDSKTKSAMFPKVGSPWETAISRGINVCGKNLPIIKYNELYVKIRVIREMAGKTKFGKNAFVGMFYTAPESKTVTLAAGFIGTPIGVFYVEDVPVEDLLSDPCGLITKTDKIAASFVLEKEYPIDVVYKDKVFYAKKGDTMVRFDEISKQHLDVIEEFGFI